MLAPTALYLLAALTAPPAADCYVSTRGNDAWSGRLAVPAVAGNDGPFATLDRARLAVRELRAARPDQGATVLVRGGLYEPGSTVLFQPEDSGVEGSPVVFAAYPGETPVFSGGRRLTGWRVTPQGWKLTLPEVKAGEWRFSQLFVNGQRRTRPRLPREGYYHIAKELSPTAEAQGKGYDRFGFEPGEITGDWHNLSDVELLCFHQWSMSRLRIQSVDAERHTVTTTGPTCNKSYWAGLQPGHRYLVENVREALDEPGEWYLDNTTGELTYLPLPGEQPDQVEVTAPRLRQLVAFQGDAGAGLPVTDLEFHGLTFAYTNWTTPASGYSFPQAEANLTAAIAANGATRIALQDCRIEHVGEYGLEFITGCRENRVEQCVVTDTGAGGIKLGTQGIPGAEANYTGWNTVRECTFSHGGRTHPAAVGVWLGHTPYNNIEHNSIYDYYYTGISVGWQWAYAPSLAHHNRIADNDVWLLGQGVLSDMGGIYTLGPADGTVIEHNRFHQVDCYGYGGWGIYFDQATTNIVARNNLVYRTETGGFHQHFGQDNHVENNIFALAAKYQLQRTRAEEHRSFFFERNLVYWTDGVLLSGNWSGDRYDLDHNLYWCASDEPFTFAGATLEQWRERGHDQHSLIADPKFADPAKLDFRLPDDSPALQIGFKPFPLIGFGRTTPGGEDALREVQPSFPCYAGPPPPRPIREDFEDCQVGDKTPGAVTYEDQEVLEATVRVTDEQAHGGQHSLKFSDQPGQQYVWNPHIFYQTGFTTGRLRESCWLYLEPGATLTHEWRDNHSPYRVGPALAVAPDGRLTSHDRALLTLPHNAWVSLEIESGLGDQADGKWQLKLGLPDGVTKEFTELPCDPKMQELRWWGFTSHATGAVAYYLDDLELAPVVQP